MSDVTFGYKVVRRERGGRLCSVSVIGESQIEYKVGEWVEAPYNPSLNIVRGLFYFSDIRGLDYYRFALRELHAEAWKCEVLEGHPLEPDGNIYTERILRPGFDKIEMQSEMMRSINEFPTWTCEARAIKLIHLVE